MTALRVGFKWMIAGELGPRIHFCRARRLDPCHFLNSSVTAQCHFCRVYYGHVIALLHHLVHVNIVKTNSFER